MQTLIESDPDSLQSHGRVIAAAGRCVQRRSRHVYGLLLYFVLAERSLFYVFIQLRRKSYCVPYICVYVLTLLPNSNRPVAESRSSITGPSALMDVRMPPIRASGGSSSRGCKSPISEIITLGRIIMNKRERKLDDE